MIQSIILILTALAVGSCGPTAVNTRGPRLNILFTTCHIGTSHKKSAMPLGEYLSHLGGHNVTVFSTFYSNPPIPSDHVTTVDLDIWTEDQAIMDQYVHGNSSDTGLNAWSITDSRNIDFLPVYEMTNDVCKRTMDQHPDIFQRILDTPWDVIVVDTYFAHCSYVISAIGSQSNRTSTTKILHSTMNPFHYTLRHVGVPTTISDNYDWQAGYDHRSFYHRLKHGIWFRLGDYYFSYYISHRIQVTLFDSYPGRSSPINPNYKKLATKPKFSMWDYDQNFSFTFYQYLDEIGVFRPHLQTDMPIGELRCTAQKDIVNLSDAYETFVSNPTSKGTIIFAMGHYVNWDHIPSKVSLAFHSAFQQLPHYRFIWQYLGNLSSSEDRRSLVNTSNLLIVDWLPQLQLLHHNKTRLIISQLGIKSTTEVICTSMPILAFPTWGDQPLSSRLLTNHHQAGKIIDRDLISPDYIANLIRYIISNELKHKAKLDKLRAYILDKPITSNELARFWIEYSVRHQNHIQILTARGRFLGFPVYYCLDLIMTSLLCWSMLILLALLFARRMGQVRNK